MDLDLSVYIDLLRDADDLQRNAIAIEIERKLGFEQPTADDIAEWVGSMDSDLPASNLTALNLNKD